MLSTRNTRLIGLAMLAAVLMSMLLGCSSPKATVTPVAGFDMPTAAPTFPWPQVEAPAVVAPPTEPAPTAYPLPTGEPWVRSYPEPGEGAEPADEPATPEPTAEPTEPTATPDEPEAYPEPAQPSQPEGEPTVAEPTAYPEPKSPAGPTEPTSESESAAPADESTGETALTVFETAFTMAELQALEQATAEIDDVAYDGVSVLAVLEAAGVGQDVENVSVASRDGYATNVPLAEVPANAVFSFEEDGTLRLLVPDMAKSSRVRDVVEVRAGDPTDAAEDQPIVIKAPIGGPVDIVDAAGREVHLDSLPQRIVVVGKGPHMSLHILYMFEEGRERVVGSESRGATPSEFLDLVFDDFSEMTYLAANPNIEQIATLQPDLVIIKGQMEDKISGALAQVDIPCMFVGLESVELFLQDLENIGAVLGNPERAGEIAAFYQERLDRLAEGTADLTDDDKPRCLLVEYFDRGGEVSVKVPAAAWMQTVELQTAGGLPVWLDSAAPTSGWTVVNIEQIAAWDPDRIFVIVWYSLDPQEVIDGLKFDETWSELSAIQNGEIYVFPQDIFGWDQPEPRWILGMEWLATRIHPDEFADIDMDAEVMRYFSTLYGMDHPTIAETILPRLKMDVR